MLSHWIAVEAVLESDANPKRPVPRGLVPTPPRYRACMRYLATLAIAGRPAREQCARKYASLRNAALEMLVARIWVEEEAAKAGVSLTVREVDRGLGRDFPTAAARRRWIAFTGLRVADERFVLEGVLLLDKLRSAVLPAFTRLRRSKGPETAQMAGEIDAEEARLQESIKKRWQPRTQCRETYLVAVCSDHPGG